MAQSIPLVEFGLDPLIDLNFLKLSFVQRWITPIENLSRTSLVTSFVVPVLMEAAPAQQVADFAAVTDDRFRFARSEGSCTS